MDLPTYTNIWRIEKRLYKLYDFRLPMPLPINWIAVFAGITIPYILLLIAIGLPFNHTLIWLYVLPPGLVTWLTTRPVIENKRLPELLESQVRYLTEPRTWVRLAPLTEKEQMVVTAQVWHSSRPAAGLAAENGQPVTAERDGNEAQPLRAPGRATRPVMAGKRSTAAGQPARTRLPARARGGPQSAPVPPLASPGVAPGPSKTSRRPAPPAPVIPDVDSPQPGQAPRPAVPRPSAEPRPADGGPIRARGGALAGARLEMSHDGPGRRPVMVAPPAPPVRPAPSASPVGTWPAPARPLRSLPRETLPPEQAPANSARPLRSLPRETLPPEQAPANSARVPAAQGFDWIARSARQPEPEAALAYEPAPAAEPETAAESRVAAEPEPEAEFEPVTEPDAELEAVAEPEPEPEAEFDPVTEPALADEPQSPAGPEGAAEPEPADGPEPVDRWEDADQAEPVYRPEPRGRREAARQALLERAHEPVSAQLPPPPPAQPVDVTAADETVRRAVPSIERALSGPSRDRNPSWHGTVKIVTGAAAAHGPAARDQEALDRNRARLPIEAPRRILILGCTTGAGQTVTALMIGHMLASLREQAVAAVDLHDGTLTRYRAPAAWLDEILAGKPPQAARPAGADGLHPAAKAGAARLDVIASHEPLGDGDEIKLAVQLSRHYPLTVLDGEPAGLTRLLKITDQLVLVAPANVEAAGALADTRDWLDAHGRADLAMQSVTVINGVSRGSLPDVEQAESIARGRSRAIVRVPWDDMLPVATTGPSTLRPQTRVAYTALAGVLVAGLSAVPAKAARMRKQ